MFRRLGPEKDTLGDISRVEGLVRDRFGVPGRRLSWYRRIPASGPDSRPTKPM
jgi:hypothetical protein